MNPPRRSPWRSLWRAVPDAPRLRFHVACGTNTAAEARTALRALLARDLFEEAPIAAFERAGARALGQEHGFAFGAGRMALHAALEALDLRSGDEVILPGYTCVVVPNAMLYRGLRPVYADVEPVTWNLDPARVEERIGPRTRAIYLQHTLGLSADVDAIVALARRHGLAVVEDCAHSLGATYRGRPHGSFGDVSFTSLDRSKVVSAHLGGLVATSNERLAARLAEIRARTPQLAARQVRAILFTFLAKFACYHPRWFWLGRPVMGALRRAGLLWWFRDENALEPPRGRPYPYPCRLSAPQARIGSSQLAGLPAALAHRRAVARWLEERLGFYATTRRLHGGFDEQCWLRYSFLVRDREEFERRLRRRFELATWFTSPVFGREGDLAVVGYVAGSCRVGEFAARHLVNLPTHPRIRLDLLERILGPHLDWIRTRMLSAEEAERVATAETSVG